MTMKLYEITQKVLKSKRVVYTTKQLSNLISCDQITTSVYISRLIKNNFAKKLIKGTISFTDNDYLIASQLYEPSYISLDSALQFHNILSQVPNNITCVTTINSKYFKNLNIYYHKINPNLFFGFKKYTMDNSYTFIADPEKALLDGLYYKIYTQKHINEFLPNINKMVFKKYAKKYPSHIQNMVKYVR